MSLCGRTCIMHNTPHPTPALESSWRSFPSLNWSTSLATRDTERRGGKGGKATDYRDAIEVFGFLPALELHEANLVEQPPPQVHPQHQQQPKHQHTESLHGNKAVFIHSWLPMETVLPVDCLVFPLRRRKFSHQNVFFFLHFVSNFSSKPENEQHWSWTDVITKCKICACTFWRKNRSIE